MPKADDLVQALSALPTPVQGIGQSPIGLASIKSTASKLCKEMDDGVGTFLDLIDSPPIDVNFWLDATTSSSEEAASSRSQPSSPWQPTPTASARSSSCIGPSEAETFRTIVLESIDPGIVLADACSLTSTLTKHRAARTRS